MTILKAKKARFLLGEEGSMTVLGMFFFVASAVAGALALDVMNLYASRTHLQTAADQAAHAALYNRSFMEADDARVAALAIVEASLPQGIYGQSIADSTITFGNFDPDTRVFSVDETSNQAVRVVTSFRTANQNAAKTYLFKLVGFDTFDIVTQAVYTTYRPGCLREGFVAEDVVDIQSGNSFFNGFCLHSNTYVSLNSNNTFGAGTIVSMPDLAQLDLPQSGFDTNEGLQAALRQASMNIRVMSRIDNMIYAYLNPYATDLPLDTEELPDYITSASIIDMRESRVETLDLTPGRVHYINCKGNSGLTIDAGDTLRDVVIISPCEIKFSANSSIENARIISQDTSSGAISSPSGLRLGRDDNCAEGGGVQLVTNGGMSFPADLQIYGSQLLAKGDIEFAANAGGLQGASLVAGGVISGTSNMEMGLCGTGMEDNIEIDYFKLAQ